MGKYTKLVYYVSWVLLILDVITNAITLHQSPNISYFWLAVDLIAGIFLVYEYNK